MVLDEAYNEYLPEDLRADSIAWLGRFPSLVVTRTFSKVYGLAGLRVGYAFAAAGVADLMNRVRQPFNVNSISLAAATAALEDGEFVRQSYELNQAGMRQLVGGLRASRRRVHPFIRQLRDASSRATPQAVYRRLLERGVDRAPGRGTYGMPRAPARDGRRCRRPKNAAVSGRRGRSRAGCAVRQAQASEEVGNG